MTDIITTAEELDALPVGSIVAWLDCDFEVDGPSVWIKNHDEWYGAGCEDSDGPSFMVDQQFHPGALTVLYRPDQPTEPVRVAPSREQIAGVALSVLAASDHEGGAGMHWLPTKRPTDQALTVSKVIADAILALFAAQPTVEQVKAGALREHRRRVVRFMPAGLVNRATVLADLDDYADRLAGGGSDA